MNSCLVLPVLMGNMSAGKKKNISWRLSHNIPFAFISYGHCKIVNVNEQQHMIGAFILQ